MNAWQDQSLVVFGDVIVNAVPCDPASASRSLSEWALCRGCGCGCGRGGLQPSRRSAAIGRGCDEQTAPPNGTLACI